MRTLLIIGAGDVARRALPLLLGHWRVLALCRTEASATRWRALGAMPLIGDLDDSGSLERLAGLADAALLTARPHPRAELTRECASCCTRWQKPTAYHSN
ncbi:Uncharacterised protein [Chromobacterium violaceum]|uniref:Uncharacterized protein n=1 Tax=Chromobacterium violaceum TaxID=536 RepID=A0A3S4IJG4_CHRVL|nr:Uncharacterised protein [Chromobacterium violaceum]